MKKIDILGIAFSNFGRRKTRSILSVLGVVIGTASIVTMMSLGIGMDVAFQEQLKRYGNMNQITVSTGWDEKTGKRTPLTDKSLSQISVIDNVTSVTPLLNLSGKIFCGKYQNYNSIVGIKLEYLEALGAQVNKGRLLSAEDQNSGSTIHVLMGSSVPYQFSKPQRSMGGGGMMWGGGGVPDGVEVPEGGWANDGIIYDDKGKEVGTYPPEIAPLDETKRIKSTCDSSYGDNTPGQDLTVKKKAKIYNLKTVGILKPGNDSYNIYVDIETAKRLKKEANKWQSSQNPSGPSGNKTTEFSYDQAYVLTDNLKNTLDVTAQIKALGFEAYSNADWITNQQESQKMIQMVLAGIGGVSLLVAAIGITNTMVMSIYERTREIGIMKVIGCYLKDIRTMFLTEAGIIGFFGGLAGVCLSYIISIVLNVLSSGGGGGISGMFGGASGAKLSVIPPWLALAAIAFAILIALVSGFFPARRAMKLSALTAMQT